MARGVLERAELARHRRYTHFDSELFRRSRPPDWLAVSQRVLHLTSSWVVGPHFTDDGCSPAQEMMPETMGVGGPASSKEQRPAGGAFLMA